MGHYSEEIFYLAADILSGKPEEIVVGNALSRLGRDVQRQLENLPDGVPIGQIFLAVLGDKICFDDMVHGVEKIPQQGGLVVVANHPTPFDGWPAAAAVTCRRQDCKMMVIHLAEGLIDLCPVFSSHMLLVDKRPTLTAKKNTLRAAQAAEAHVANGGALIIFPAGRIQTLEHWYNRTPVEQEWKHFTGQLARMDGVQTVPIYIDAQMSRPSLIFRQFVSEYARRAIFYLEYLRHKDGAALSLIVGDPIPSARLRQFENDQTAANFLRQTTLALKP